MMPRTILLILLFGCVTFSSAAAQDEQQLKERVKQLEQETQELKARLSALETQRPVTQSSGQPALRPAVLPAPSPTPPPQPTPSQPISEKDSSAAPTKTDSVPLTANTDARPEGQEQQPAESKASMDIYGFAQLDTGYDFGQNDPNWFDVMRPTKLPAFTNQFKGRNGIFYSSVRQTRFGVKTTVPTAFGDLKTIFEFELFGTGVDAGQTTFRLRHAWGELGQFGAGQTWSPFMDPDVFPNSLEYWGPNGMVFFRNVQLRWQPINNGNKQLWFALERPGASVDESPLTQRVQLAGVTGRFPVPDMSARLRWGGERGHIQIAGIGRYIAWDDPARNSILDLSGHTWGWGVNVSSNVPVAKKDVIKLSATYGRGIQNYMNDAPVDVAPVLTTNLRTPVAGEAIPVFGMVAFYDRYWSERWSTSIGYSMLNMENVATQTPDSFHRGHYGLANLLFYPVKNVMTGAEFQWGRRDNFRDGFMFDDYRIQFSAKYNFDYKLGGTK
jgi:hypothetical protein